MTAQIRHLMDEADIGSGEKSPAELETQHQINQIGRSVQAARPLDGRQQQSTVDEQTTGQAQSSKSSDQRKQTDIRVDAKSAQRGI